MYAMLWLCTKFMIAHMCVFSFQKVETMRTSTDCIVKMMFTNQLSKTGNLTMACDEQQVIRSKSSGKSKWGAALVAEKTSTKVKSIKIHTNPTFSRRTLYATCTVHIPIWATYNHTVTTIIHETHISHAPSLYDTTFIKIINVTHNPHIYFLFPYRN